jgi:hypothetical protein
MRGFIFYCLSQHHTTLSSLLTISLSVSPVACVDLYLVLTILLVSLTLILFALCMHQVNQRTTTTELAERANKHFLFEPVSSLVWETRHWANKMRLIATLAPTIGDNPNSSSSDSSTVPMPNIGVAHDSKVVCVATLSKSDIAPIISSRSRPRGPRAPGRGRNLLQHRNSLPEAGKI